ncbi:hypothetical protein [Streptomyces gardneri]|uniref:hypothetical protein n=1 Tax=Streptomyces gardneri TaxID=66892 RepID=UPI0037D959E1
MSKNTLRLASKFVTVCALVALPTFGIATVATQQSAPVATVAGTTTDGETATTTGGADTAAVPTPTPSTSKDTTGWD